MDSTMILSPGRKDLNSSVFSCGLSSDGQLGLGTDDTDTNPTTPTPLTELFDKLLYTLSCGSKHAAAVTLQGELYTWGNNDEGQLGRRRKLGLPIRVEAMEQHFVTQVACGQAHTIVLTNDKRLFAFGRNNFGQLGVDPQETPSSLKPRLIKALSDKDIVKISCGSNHCVALTDNGVVWSWGSSIYGQTGRGYKKNWESPLPVQGVEGVPLIDVACGGDFTVLLTISGNVYTFGLGNSGQLGLGDKQGRLSPQMISKLQGLNIVKLSCGFSHCIAHDIDGRLYGWGSSEYGQICSGNLPTDSPALDKDRKCGFVEPVSILEANNLKAVDVTTGHGSRHSLVVVKELVQDSDRLGVYAFGKGTYGQLGNGSTTPSFTPVKIDIPLREKDGDIQAFAGEDYSLFINKSRNLPPIINPSSASVNYNGIQYISLLQVTNLIVAYQKDNKVEPFVAFLDKCFSWPNILNASFVVRNKRAYDVNVIDVDLVEIREMYHRILKLQKEEIVARMNQAISRCLKKNPSSLIFNPESMRFYLVILENPTLTKVTRMNLPLLERLVTSITGLSTQPKQILFSWFGNMPSEFFANLIQVFQSLISFIHVNQVDDRLVFATTKILAELYNINSKKSIVPDHLFYNDDVTAGPDLEKEYQRWLSSRGAVFSYLHYPFFMSAVTKTRLLHFDASCQQMVHSLTTLGEPFLILNIRRDHLILDALSQISMVHPTFLKKPLKIRFIGEMAVDEGGPRQEFFQLIIEQLFQADYGIFLEEPESHYCWFNPKRNSIIAKLDDEVFLVGILFGLAIYNSVLLNVHFPPVLWKKILKTYPGASYTERNDYKLTLDDVKTLFPTVGRNLQYLLDYTGDVQGDFDQVFEVTEQGLGVTTQYELIPNGRNIPVTTENRQLFVDKYVDYLLNVSINKSFESFYNGFYLVCGAQVLQLYTAEELELCVCGATSSIDTRELEQRCVYRGGVFNRNHPYILQFWNIVHQLSQEQKKKLLMFTTGTDRLPAGGIKNLEFCIQRNGADIEQLPTAMTCSHVLLLPEYSSAEKLKEKLIIALENCKGFGLI